MQEGGFDHPRNKVNKASDNQSKSAKDAITPILNKKILESIADVEDETIKIDGVVCTRFLAVGQIISYSTHNN